MAVNSLLLEMVYEPRGQQDKQYESYFLLFL